jgi:hypothetical protein
VALITSFEHNKGTSLGRHKTEVAARVFVFGDGPTGPIVQINTYGSPNREFPEKVSQSIQLDRKAAEELWTLLGKEYGFR